MKVTHNWQKKKKKRNHNQQRKTSKTSQKTVKPIFKKIIIAENL